MTGWVQRLLATLQLTRIALVFTAISNIWLVVLLSRVLAEDHPSWATAAIGTLGLTTLLAYTGVVAIGMYVFGMSLNDILDIRRDRAFAPERPLCSGRIGLGTAIGVCVGALGAAIAASIPLGTTSFVFCLICAAMIVFYNAFAKHMPGVGVLTLGLIRAVHMLIANPLLGFCWPVWLTMSHIIGISAASHRLEAKRPRLEGIHLWLVTGGWAFVTIAAIGWMNHKGALNQTPYGTWLWTGPILAAGTFLAMALRSTDRAASERGAGKQLMKLGLLWLIVYDTTWLIGMARWWEAAIVGSMLPAAWVSMWLIRRLTGSARETSHYVRDDHKADHPNPDTA